MNYKVLLYLEKINSLTWMKKIYLLFIIAIAVYSKSFAQTVTWADNVACLFYTHCTSCHHPGGIAPFSLMDYTNAYNNDSDIQLWVNNGSMPPWPPDQSYTNLAHPRILTQQEINLINQWVAQGATEGNPGNAPTPPTYSGAAQITNPDLSLRIPDYTLPVVMTNDVYRCFVVPSGLTADKYVTSMEVLPGNTGIVHHVLLFEDTASTVDNLDANDPGPGYTCFGGVGSSTAKLIGGYTPGQTADNLPAGMGIKLNTNTRLIAQIHYPQGSDGQLDSTRFSFKFSSTSLREVTIAALLNETKLINGPLYIPANTVQSFTERYQIPPVNFSVISVLPHMHLLGQAIKSYSISTVGDTTKLINIPSWEFHWQGSYYFRHPVKVPASSTLYAQAMYDNTTNNPENPNSPPVDVQWGEQTTDEMMMVFFGFLPYMPGDENIVIDTSTSVSTWNNCNEFNDVTGVLPAAVSEFSVYPNPSTGKLFIKNPSADHVTLRFYNMMGTEVMTRSISSSRLIDVSSLSPDTYAVRIERNGEISYKKIVISGIK
jgi:hypothetical protein